MATRGKGLAKRKREVNDLLGEVIHEYKLKGGKNNYLTLTFETNNEGVDFATVEDFEEPQTIEYVDDYKNDGVEILTTNMMVREPEKIVFTGFEKKAPDAEKDNVMDTDEEKEASGYIAQMKRIVELYREVATHLGLSYSEMKNPSNESNIMKLFDTARRSQNEGIKVASSYTKEDGTSGKITMTQSESREMFKTWLESEPQLDGDDEKKRKRAVDAALGMYEMWKSNFQNIFYSNNRRTSRSVNKLCTPFSSGINGAGNAMSSMTKVLDAPVIIDQIMNIHKSERMDKQRKNMALKAKLTGLKNSLPLDSQRNIVAVWINRAENGELSSGNKALNEEFRNTMKMVAISSCGTGTRKTIRYFPSASLMMEKVGASVPVSMSGFKFMEWYNQKVVDLIFSAQNSEALDCLMAGYAMSVFNMIYEHLGVVSTIMGRQVESRESAYKRGLVKPRPGEEKQKTVRGGRARIAHFFKSVSAIPRGSDSAQMQNTHYIKCEHKNEDKADEIIEKIQQILFGARGQTPSVSINQMMSEAMSQMKKPNLFVGSKLYLPNGAESDAKPMATGEPFYWGMYGMSEVGQQSSLGKRPSSLFGNAQPSSSWGM